MSQFVIDCSAPADDQIFDCASFEKFLKDRVKVNGKTNNLEEGQISISRDGSMIRFQCDSEEVSVSKRYLKYLTKKFLKKHQLRDWLRVISTDKNTYVVKYFRVGDDDAEDDAEEEEASAMETTE